MILIIFKKTSDMYYNSSCDLNELNSLFTEIIDRFQQKFKPNFLLMFLKKCEFSLDCNEQTGKIKSFFKLMIVKKLRHLFLII